MVSVGNEALKRTENGRTVPVAQTDKLKLESLEPPPGLPHPCPPPLLLLIGARAPALRLELARSVAGISPGIKPRPNAKPPGPSPPVFTHQLTHAYL